MRRSAFTLIELLVTMGLIIVLLSLVVVVSNSATLDSYKVIGAGDKLAQSLLTAKSRAARDKAPRGVRLMMGTDGFVRELIYIESPEPWLPDSTETLRGASTVPNIPDRSLLVLKYPQPPAGGAGTFPKPNAADCRVYLVLTANDVTTLVPQITGTATATVTSPDIAAGFTFDTLVAANAELEQVPAGLNAYRLQLNGGSPAIVDPDLCAGQTPSTNPTRGTLQTVNFGVYLPARPLAGEPTIILSRNSAVDPNASLPTFSAQQDILFAPSGQVMLRSEGLIAFLIRDTYKFTPSAGTVADTAANYKQAGEMVLVAIYPKNGTVATKPVAEPNGTPEAAYQFAKDAINSGL